MLCDCDHPDCPNWPWCVRDISEIEELADLTKLIESPPVERPSTRPIADLSFDDLDAIWKLRDVK